MIAKSSFSVITLMIVAVIGLFNSPARAAASALNSMTYNSGPASTNWASPSLSTIFVAPSGMGSIHALCGLGPLFDTWIDQIDLNNAGGTY